MVQASFNDQISEYFSAEELKKFVKRCIKSAELKGEYVGLRIFQHPFLEWPECEYDIGIDLNATVFKGYF